MIDLGQPLVRLVARRRSAAVTAAVGALGPAPTWIGLEHEYLVFDEAGRRVDFRCVIHGLNLGRPNLLPLDRHAFPLGTGSVVTADMNEAEIAVPPISLAPGFARRMDGWAAFERERLRRRVNPLTLRGDSTHISFSLPARVDPDRVADLFATRFSLGLMLLMDRRHSPGLLVRPRPYRLELGGEYAVGRSLRAALAFAIGGALACIEAARAGSSAALPVDLAPRLERGVMRYGWYVGRTAFGDDLYADGRSMAVTGTDGGQRTAGEALSAAWAVARRHIEPHVRASDLADCDAMIEGRLPLPIESDGRVDEVAVSRQTRPRSAFGSAIEPRRRETFDLAPVMITWQSAVFLVADREMSRTAYVAVPGHGLAPFLAALDGGALDRVISRCLALRPAGLALRSTHQARSVGVFDELGLRAGLLAPERDYWGRPVSLRLATAGHAPGAVSQVA